VRTLVPTTIGQPLPYVVVGNKPASSSTAARGYAAVTGNNFQYNPATRFAKYFPPAPLPYCPPVRIPTNEPKPSLVPCMPLVRFRGSAEQAPVTVLPTPAVVRRIALRTVQEAVLPAVDPARAYRTDPNFIPRTLVAPPRKRSRSLSPPAFRETKRIVVPNIGSVVVEGVATSAVLPSGQEFVFHVESNQPADGMALRSAILWGAPPIGTLCVRARRALSAAPVYRKPPRKPRMGEEQFYKDGTDPLSLYLAGKNPFTSLTQPKKSEPILEHEHDDS
jgi:hypothetical protein